MGPQRALHIQTPLRSRLGKHHSFNGVRQIEREGLSGGWEFGMEPQNLECSNHRLSLRSPPSLKKIRFGGPIL